MVNVTTLTFVIGTAAAAAVREQLRQTTRSPDLAHPDAGRLADRIDRRLVDSPAGFELSAEPLRLVWQSGAAQAGMLCIVRNEQIMTVNLLLGELADSQTVEMQCLERFFKPLNGYRRCLELVRQAPRPVIASFCCAGGQLDLPVEASLFTFAAVFFRPHRARVAHCATRAAGAPAE